MAETPAPIPFEELIHSDLFTFIIGKECKRFILHSKAVAATSPFFSALVNGGMNETQTRVAELQDVDPDTFARFTEYAYRRDYTVPMWRYDEKVAVPVYEIPPPEPPAGEEPSAMDPTEPEVEPVVIEEPAEPPSPVYIPGTRVRYTKKKKKVTMRSNFAQHTYLVDGQKPRDALIGGFEPTWNSSAERDFTNVFLAHAKMYTLADMRLVLPLKPLALHKLHQTLSSFFLHEERLADVLELAKYAYSQGEDRSENGKLDELRELVVKYIACDPKAFSAHKDFKYLMDSEGEFAGDLWGVIMLEFL